jgi:ubiquinone/menaquinone biosynthesis C-methylase UbiE
MNIQEAIDLIRPGIKSVYGTWADIGAGTGIFTKALMQILQEGHVIALDKNPHLLYDLEPTTLVGIEVKEGDFNQALELPSLDGILMANALHYAPDHFTTLTNVLASLKTGVSFILIEYDTERPNVPWVPYPVSLNRFKELCTKVGLSAPELIGTRNSIYQDGSMYATWCEKEKPN